MHLGSLREPGDIAALGAASLPKVLPVEASQIVVWDELGVPDRARSLARRMSRPQPPLSAIELEVARAQTDPSVVCQVLDLAADGQARGSRSIVWFPLRANAGELGALVGINRDVGHVDPIGLDTAAVLAAHVAASLDAAFALGRERLSAATDPLTGILNRRGLEDRLERALAAAQEQRVPLSLLVIDCDDFKEINDRAGHEFGDALLREVADVLLGALPEGAEAARLGGDEFVVMLPAAGADAAEALGGQIRTRARRRAHRRGLPAPDLGRRLDVPLRRSDADLAAARRRSGAVCREDSRKGSDRLVPRRSQAESPYLGRRRAGRARGHGGVAGTTGPARCSPTPWQQLRRSRPRKRSRVCAARLCKALVFVVGATACSASRVVGDFIVDATEHALREVSLGDEAAYRIADFPLTAEVLRER